MTATRTAVVTGAFGYSGRSVAQRLLDRDIPVRTLTNHPQQQRGKRRIEVCPLDFDDVDRLAAAMTGAHVVYNTYWVRFAHGGATHEVAVRNTKKLIDAAVAAGVGHFVHVSIANPDTAPELSYYRGKAELETYLGRSGVPFSIIRPTVVYGRGDILINNIAWFLRHLPIFGIPGDGQYGIQPVYIDDYADLMVATGEGPARGAAVDAVGPDSYSFIDLVRLIRHAVRSRAAILNVPPSLALLGTGIVGKFLGDVILTGEEVQSLLANLLVSPNNPTCTTRFDDWLAAHADDLGRKYASELARRK